MIEPLILAHLIRDEEYLRKVFPFLRKEYFSTPPAQQLFKVIHDFVVAYRVPPTVDAIHIALDQAELIGTAYTDATKLLESVIAVARVDASRRQWLLDQTEAHCKQRALYLAISESITRIDKNVESAASVPGLLKEALAVGFETNVGHDYLEDIGTRYDLLHLDSVRIPFDLTLFNEITGGGLTPKTLNVVVAGTNVGKSLFLCHVAAAAIERAKKVLYVTLEMAEERIAQRIDANLLDISMDNLERMPKLMYEQAFANMKARRQYGKLIIKEYPTSMGHAGHFRLLLDELALKKGFIPDLLIVDYINLCASIRFTAGGNVNSYTYVKAIAEELRGLAVEYKLPVLTATQFNREGFDSSDPSLTDTSESFGLPQTADLQVALVTSEELEQDGLMMVKQLKNRYADRSRYRRFTVRLDRSKMRFSDDPNQQFTSHPPPSAPTASRKSGGTPDPTHQIMPKSIGPTSTSTGGAHKITFS